MRTSYRFLRASMAAAFPCLVALVVLAVGVGFVPTDLLSTSQVPVSLGWAVFLLLAGLYASVVLAFYAVTRLLGLLGCLSRASLLFTLTAIAFALGLLLGFAPTLPLSSLLFMGLVAAVALAGFIPAALLWWRVAAASPSGQP
jgi:hypothetical protein